MGEVSGAAPYDTFKNRKPDIIYDSCLKDVLAYAATYIEGSGKQGISKGNLNIQFCAGQILSYHRVDEIPHDNAVAS